MPSKKASTATDKPRKSDLSTARFVPIEGADTPEPATASKPSGTAAAGDATTATGAADEETQSQSDRKDGGKEKDKDAVTIEDLTLPKSIITRLAKGALPPNTQIQANAVLALSKSATVFINYLASHANEHTFNANKKTISPADVFKALDDIEFGFLKEPLEAEFAKFTALQAEKRNTYRKKSTKAADDTDMADISTISKPEDQTATTTTTTTNPNNASTTANGDEEATRATKKQRTDVAGAGGSETEDEIDATVDEREEDDEDEEEEVEVEEEEEEEEDSGDETQDALEDRPRREERDEALDGDDSD